MAKNKSGLHKEISSIFDGVPIPKGRDADQKSAKPTPGRIGYVPAKMPEPPPQPRSAPQAPQPARVSEKVQRAAAGKKTGPIKDAPPAARLSAKKRGVSTTRQKVMAAMIPVLIVAIVAVLARNSGIIPTRSAPVTTNEAVYKAAMAPNFRIDWQIPAAYKAHADDPMARSLADLRHEVKTVAQLIVKGTVISEDTAYAIIDTEIVQVGQKVLGATVVAISPDTVEFERDGTKWTQQVHKPKDGR